MTSTPIKDIGVVAGRSSTSTFGTSKSGSDVSFEAVWNKQTDRNDAADKPEQKEAKPVSQKEDGISKDSLKQKDSHKSTVTEDADEMQPKDLKDLEDMDPKEWEAAMEVLGTVTVELIQQIADSFGMEPEAVQDLMADLGMKQMDLLQPENLGELLLAVGGAEDATALLTDGEFYQQYQSLMEQRNVLLEQSGEILQADPEQLVELAVQQQTPAAEEVLPVEMTTEEATMPTADDVDDANGKEEKPASTQEGTVKGTVTEEPAIPDVSRQAENGTKHNEESAQDKGQTGNLMLQNLRTDSAEPQLQQVAETSSAWDNDTQDIMRQIMDYMKIQVKPDMSNLEMQLHPENLGTLQINVASKGGVITAQFMTQNETVKAALESQMIQLQDSFEQQGVKVEAIEVTVQTHQFEQNLEQGRGRQQEPEDRRAKTRRIRLDGPLTMEQLADMEEEEALAAQMMEANGNTVDYTA